MPREESRELRAPDWGDRLGLRDSEGAGDAPATAALGAPCKARTMPAFRTERRSAASRTEAGVAADGGEAAAAGDALGCATADNAW